MQRNSLNRVMLVGHLGKDPDIKYTPKGTAFANFSMATNESRKNDKGDWNDHTEWHRVVLWGKTAEFAEQYIKKGSMLLVEGRLQTRNWEDKDKAKHYVTEVVGERITMLGSGARKEDEASVSGDESEEEEALPF